MPLRMWLNPGWADGTVKIGTGGTGLADGTLKEWPWAGGADLVGDLKALSYVGAQGFGGGEWANNTLYAASQLFTDSRLNLVRDRLIGAVDLRMLSGTAGVDKLVLSFDSSASVLGTSAAVSSITTVQWASVMTPSPVGGAAQPAAFWDNPTYPTKSVVPAWLGKQILAPLIRDANAVPQLIAWANANPAAKKQVIGVSDTYAHCQSMKDAGMYAVQRWPSAAPSGSDISAAATYGIYGFLVNSASLTGTLINSIKTAGLKVWVYNADTPALVKQWADLGVNAIYTTAPIAALTGTLPPVPPPQTIWGYGAESWSEVQAKMSGGLGVPRVVRSYNGTSSNAGPVIPADLRGRRDPQNNYVVIWDSWKPDMATMKSPSALETMATNAVNYLTANIPMGQQVYCTIWHEPEETSNTDAYNWRKHFSSTSEWQTAWRAAHTALYNKFVTARAAGHKFYVAPLICDWTIWNTGKGSAASWYPLNWTTYDVMGWDIYATGQKTSATNKSICRLWCDSDYVVVPYTDRKSTENPNGQGWYAIETIARMARERNKPWVNGETGLVRGDSLVPAPDPSRDPLEYSSHFRYSGRQRAQRSYDMIQHCASLPNPPLLWCWYDTTGCKVSGFPGDPAGSGGGDNWPAGLTIAAWNSTLDPAYNGVPD